MKNSMKIILLLALSWLAYSLPAQENCMVLKPEIAGKYTGKCKNGFAQGKGTPNFKSNGKDSTLGESVGYENIIFPVTIKINYSTLNKLHSSQFYASFEFEIFERGDWVVDIYN